ncbi:MAG: hypothetical protein IBX57_00425 [Gammaproteobacteria bacterium]|nr:hypothetical protein [Gammaproteobacteria bacterium]
MLEKSIENWADICEMKSDSIATQMFVAITEVIETFEGFAELDKQEIMDGLVDFNWMVHLIKHVSGGSIDLFHQLDQVKAIVEKHYPGLIDAHFEPYKQAVLDSNYSKFVITLSELNESVSKYTDINVKVHGEKNDEYGIWVIKCSETTVGSDGNHYKEGKILKGINYFKPNYKV